MPNPYFSPTPLFPGAQVERPKPGPSPAMQEEMDNRGRYRSYLDFIQELENSPYGQRQTAIEQSNREYVRQQAEREYQLRVDQLKQQAEQIKVTQGNAKAQQWYQRESLKLQQQAQQDARLRAERSDALDLYKFNTSRDDDLYKFGQNQGMQLLQLGSSLRGPSTAFQYLDVLEGAQRMQPASGFLGSLARGEYAPPTRGGVTGRATVQGMAQQMSDPKLTIQPVGQGPSTLGDLQARRAADLENATTIAKDPSALGQQALERMDPYQREYLKGAIEYTGGDWNSFLNQYRGSRWANPG